ncbi:hypothetical protein TRFO_06486 [Tritrichomonas foetus]|uniref:Uncharacterized protein n=1 Tax=Tritrichomonas foetus TaxID=1144522 RepID=A0A1J4K3U8_9EUKA|nr:hypothetical protein TRFO_06486 [Tritrichomonas foetus]|eukprot:OHT04157.1 hypothetical protein TRFO_06486 [Tritrichomonas foetus]
MEALFSQYEQNVKDMKNRLESYSDSNTVDPSERDLIKRDMENLEKSIFDMSKQCLSNLELCNDMLEQMSSDINGIEGETKVIKDSKAAKTQLKANKPTQGVTCSALLVESQSQPQIFLPTCDFTLSMECLSEIGQKMETIGTGPPLIRKIGKENEPHLWTRDSDYFVKATGMGPSTFNEIYNTTVPTFTASST